MKYKGITKRRIFFDGHLHIIDDQFREYPQAFLDSYGHLLTAQVKPKPKKNESIEDNNDGI